jgi:hypothetical protein
LRIINLISFWRASRLPGLFLCNFCFKFPYTYKSHTLKSGEKGGHR